MFREPEAVTVPFALAAHHLTSGVEPPRGLLAEYLLAASSQTDWGVVEMAFLEEVPRVIERNVGGVGVPPPMTL